jgi:hypothetical protein
VTLNIATQKSTGWKYFDQLSVNPRYPPNSELTVNQMIDNAKFFLNFMTYKNNCTKENDM